METEDARRLSPAEQHERRRQVIRAWMRGQSKAQIACDVGLSYPGTCKIIARFEAGGMKGLAPHKRGRSEGDKRVLDSEHEAWLRKTICDHRPEQLKMEFVLWTRIAVRRKSRSSAPMNSRRQPCKLGSMKSTRRLKSAPRRKKPRFTGMTKRLWSILMFEVAAMRLEGKHL